MSVISMSISSAITLATTLVQPRNEHSIVSSGVCARSVPLRDGGSSINTLCWRAEISVRECVGQSAFNRIFNMAGISNAIGIPPIGAVLSGDHSNLLRITFS